MSSRAVVAVSVPLRPNSATGPGMREFGRDRAEQDLSRDRKAQRIGTDHPHVVRARRGERGHRVVDRHELGGRDREPDAGLRALDDGVAHAGGRRVDDGGPRAARGNRFGDRVEGWNAVDRGGAASRRDTGDNPGTGGEHAGDLRPAVASGAADHDDRRVRIGKGRRRITDH